jgi:hypothetical protein
VSNTSQDIVHAVYVPQEARDFRIDEENRLEYTYKMECESETITLTKELNTELHDLKYKEMQKARGKTDDSFSYQMDENMKKVAAKVQAWHGGDLNGVSATHDRSIERCRWNGVKICSTPTSGRHCKIAPTSF